MKEITIKVAEVEDLRQGVINVLKKFVEHDERIHAKIYSMDYTDPYQDIEISLYGLVGKGSEIKVSRQPYIVRGTIESFKNIACLADDAFTRLELKDEERKRYAYFFVDSELMDAVLDALEVIRTSFKDAVRLG